MVEGAYVDDDRVRVAEAYALTPEMSARVAASTELLALLPQYVWCDDGDTLEYIVSPLGFKYRVLSFTNDAEAQTEQPYIDLARHVLAHGHLRPDRTGVGTIGVFGAQMRFDISKSVPLLTTKRVPWKMCIEELLWFLRGDTDAKVLQRKGIKIWDGNTSREFLDARGLGHYEAGVLGPGYGWAMRHFGGAYDPSLADTSTLSDAQRASLGGADQVAYVLDQLRTDPFSRRILMCYWNPCDFDKIALLPCHFACQFYVDMDGNGVKHLSCHLNMRSNDLFLGNPCNLFGYAVLTYILAAKTGMRPKELVYTGGDVHIYANHVDQMNELFERDMRPLPMLVLDASVKNKDFSEMTIDDFDVVGYFPHPTIAAPMAV
jgi:thymidylate synthase